MKIPIQAASGLETVLEKVGRSLSERFGIRVVCRGAQCCTNGRTIFLPSLPDELPPAMLQIIRGYLDHEAGHLLGKSNFRILKWFKDKYGAEASHFLNMLEDLRIEEVMRQRFPGSRKNLTAAHRYLIEDAGKSIEPMPVLRQLAFGVASRGNRQPDLPFVGPEVRRILDMIQDAVLKAPRCRNTKAIARLAEEAWPVVSQLLTQQPVPAPDGASAGQSTADSTPSGDEDTDQASGQPNTAQDEQIDAEDDSDGEEERGCEEEGENGAGTEEDNGRDDTSEPVESGAAQAGDDPDHGGTDAEDDSDDEEEEGAETEKNGDQDDTPEPNDADSAQIDGDPQNGSANAQDSAAAPDIMRSLATAITDMVNDYSQAKRAYRIWTTERDTVATASNKSTIPHHQRMAALLPHVAGVRQKLLQTLLAEPKARWLGDKEAGRINPRMLHRLASPRAENAGNDRVFRERVRTKRLHTAVTLLIDQSGSMAGQKIALARNTALVFCEALSRLDIPCCVVGFSTEYTDYYDQDTIAKTGLPFDQLISAYRIVPLRHIHFKHFHESFRAVSGRFDSMEASVATPLGESVLFAARELACRREERKVLFVLTDGRPTVGLGDDSATFQHAKDSIKRVEHIGIDVALVGILEDSVTELHHRSVVVNSLHELPKTVMRQLQSILINHHPLAN